MRTSIVFIVILFLAGCGAQGRVAQMPGFKTEQGRMNARDCQDAYSECVEACEEMYSSGLFNYLKHTQALRNYCYKICE